MYNSWQMFSHANAGETQKTYKKWRNMYNLDMKTSCQGRNKFAERTTNITIV
jgi:hypothetical protein